MFWMMDARRIPGWGILENVVDGLPQLDELETMAKPGMMKRYLEDLMPYLKSFVLRIVIAVLIYVVGRRLIKWMRKVLHNAMVRSSMDKGIRQFLDSFAKIVLNFVLLIAVVGQLGVETASLAAVLSSAGLTLGLALQGSLSNFAGGVLILLFRPFKVGDYIIEDTHKNEGTVKEIMIFYTKLTTVDNRVIVVPNGTLANASLTNVTQQEKRRVDLYVGISYNADVKKAKKLLEEMARLEPLRIEDEEISVFVDALEDSCVKLGCRVWVQAEHYWQVKWDLTERIKEIFDENQIEIPYQHLNVYLKQP